MVHPLRDSLPWLIVPTLLLAACGEEDKTVGGGGGNGGGSPPACTLEVDTHPLVWKDVGVGYVVTRRHELHNTGDADCVASLAAEGAGFSIEGDSIRIDPGSSALVAISWKPEDEGEATGALRATSGTTSFTVPLEGEAIASCLEIALTSLDFGEVQPGCGSRTETIGIRNDCSHPVGIASVSMDGGPQRSHFAVKHRPSDAIGPGGRSEFEVIYRPAELGTHESSLSVTEPNGAATTIRLQGSGAHLSLQTDVFVQPEQPRVDVLFVIDDSAAMVDRGDAIQAFARELLAEQRIRNASVRWGVTTTSRTATDGCLGSGADGRLVPFDGSGPRWLDAGAANLPDEAFLDLLDVGTCSAAPNEGIAAAVRALATLGHEADDVAHPEANDGNAGFLRDGSNAWIYFFSATDDASEGTVDEAFNRLRGIRPINRLKLQAAIVPPGGCGGDVGATRYADLARRSGAEAVSLCEHEALSGLVPGFSGFPAWESVELTTTPFDLDEDGDVADGFEVRLGDEPWAAVDDAGNTRWFYDADRNMILFGDGFVPAEGSTFSVTYPVTCG